MKKLYKKLNLLFVLLIFFTVSNMAQNAWINEIHYDNAGTDAGEFIEVVIEDAGSYTLSDFSVILYNGSNGTSYNTKTLDLFTPGVVSNEFSIFYYTYPVDGIQNGAPDGMALSYQGTLITGQFLSYEGAFTGSGGPADGVSSTNIGVSETSSTPVGYSLQLSGSGSVYGDFVWQAPADDTPGALNNSQTFSAPATPTLIANPSVLSGFSYSGAGPSASQSYLLSGINLTGFPDNIAVLGTTNYEVSLDNSTFYASVSVPFTSATLTETPIYVRLKSGLSLGAYENEDITNTGGDADIEYVTCNGAVVLPQPSGHASNFQVASTTSMEIQLTWSEATGATLPQGYLVKGSAVSYADIAEPIDNVEEADATLVKNVVYGAGTVTFTNLNPNTTYYFKIWPYTNSGIYIDYKLDGTVPQQFGVTYPLYFRSAASGDWNVASTWEISDDNSSWIPSTSAIPEYSTTDVTIKSGHAVTYPTSYFAGSALDLTVENGATLYANASSGTRFLYVYGDILNDGTIGGATDIIGFDIEGSSCNISGTGSFIASRMAKFTTVNATTNLTLNQDLTLTYTSTTGNALYNGQSATTTFNITVAPGKNLSVLNAGINLDGCTLTLESDMTGSASLIDNGVSGSGASNVAVQRYIGAWIDALHGWHFLSSPVTTQAIAPEFTDPTPANYDFYAWDEVNNIWLNQKEVGNGITGFVPGTGYLVAYQSADTKEFSGTLNTSDVTVNNLTQSGGANNGWNLAGNPFPSALVWNDGVNWTVPADIAATAKIWNEANASYSDIAANGIIPALNGFMVQVVANPPASLTIPTAARTHDATPWYKSTSDFVKLVAYDYTNSTAQECYIKANELATEAYDAAYDSRFLAGYAPQFYATAGSEVLSTNTLPDLDNGRTVEMAFVKNSASQFTIALDPESSMGERSIFLTDKKTGIVTDLAIEHEYTFTAEDGDAIDRFRVHFGALGLDESGEAVPFSIFSANGAIYLHVVDDIRADVSIVNLLGQTIMQSRIDNEGLKVIDATGLENGIYMVRVSFDGKYYTEKVYINR